jgi:hypothetical protein
MKNLRQKYNRHGQVNSSAVQVKGVARRDHQTHNRFGVLVKRIIKCFLCCILLKRYEIV